MNSQNSQIVNKLQLFFPAYHVEKAWIFGSYARGEETRKSDIDVMVEFTDSSKLSLLDYIGIKVDLEKLLRKKVDLVENGYVKNFAQQAVEQDKKLIYERAN